VIQVECPYCERRCTLTEDDGGFCRTYQAMDGEVVERFPHRYSSSVISHIEAIPFYHFQPGSRSLLLGGAGCNFDCHYCSNAYVARCDPEPLLTLHLPPERVVRFAEQAGCHNIVFGVNESTVALPTLLALSSVARTAGLPIGVLTNGYMQPEIAIQMGEAFDFVNISLKAMAGAFYREYVGVPSAEVAKRNIEILYGKAHLEVSTPIVQGLNDGDIPAIADFIASVSSEIPWHVFRLLPEYKMADYERPPIEAVNTALEAAREKLPYIYFGNFVGSQWVSTICPQCGSVAVERINLGGCGAKPLTYHLAVNRCATCDYALPIAGERVTWNSKDGRQ
jgi:pyruvate-formate lyase-activating enzyme